MIQNYTSNAIPVKSVPFPKRISYRYMCLDCLGADHDQGVLSDVEPGEDDECRCPHCAEVLSSFEVLECAGCGEWACTAYPSDVEKFLVIHACRLAVR